MMLKTRKEAEAWLDKTSASGYRTYRLVSRDFVAVSRQVFDCYRYAQDWKPFEVWTNEQYRQGG